MQPIPYAQVILVGIGIGQAIDAVGVDGSRAGVGGTNAAARTVGRGRDSTAAPTVGAGIARQRAAHHAHPNGLGKGNVHVGVRRVLHLVVIANFLNLLWQKGIDFILLCAQQLCSGI